MLLAVPGLAIAQDAPVKLTVEIENLGSASGKELQKALKNLTAVQECAVQGSKLTVTLVSEKKFKLSDLKDAVAGLKPDKDSAEIKIKLDSLKLEGKLLLAFAVSKNAEKIASALKSVNNVMNVAPSGSDYEVTIKSPAGAKFMDLATAVAKACGEDEAQAADVVKNITWTGAAKPSGAAPVKQPPKKGS